MKTPDKEEYAKSASEKQKSRFRSLQGQGLADERAWSIVFNEPDANQPYEDWPKAELEILVTEKGIENSADMSKAALLDALRLP